MSLEPKSEKPRKRFVGRSKKPTGSQDGGAIEDSAVGFTSMKKKIDIVLTH
jgi:hypothetical protein